MSRGGSRFFSMWSLAFPHARWLMRSYLPTETSVFPSFFVTLYTPSALRLLSRAHALPFRGYLTQTAEQSAVLSARTCGAVALASKERWQLSKWTRCFTVLMPERLWCALCTYRKPIPNSINHSQWEKWGVIPTIHTIYWKKTPYSRLLDSLFFRIIYMISQ